MTVEELAARVAARGGALSRSAITKIELGRRNVTIDEALLLADALNVPPAQLLFPMESEEKVRVTPKNALHPHLAHEWLAGKDGLSTTDLGEWKEAAWPLFLYDDLRQAQNATHKAYSSFRMAQKVGTKEEIRQAHRGFLERLEALATVLKQMRNRVGMVPPKMPEEWEHEMVELGLTEGED